MPSLLVHRASELRIETRAALEAELGRSLQDDEEVSIMTFAPPTAPTGEARREAGRNLQNHFYRVVVSFGSGMAILAMRSHGQDARATGRTSPHFSPDR